MTTYPSFSFTAPRCSMVGTPGPKDGLCGVFNRSDPYSGGYLDIREVWAMQMSPTGDSSGLLSNNNIIFCDELLVARTDTAPTLGSGEVVTGVAFDTAAALPSQVKCYAMPDESPAATNSALRRSSFFSYNSFVATLTNMYSSLGTQGLYRATPGSQTEPIALREGEGLVVLCDQYISQRRIPLEVVVNDRATGHTFMFRTEDATYSTGRYTQPVLSLFNGAGSGVVLDVYIVNNAYGGDPGESAGPGFGGGGTGALSFQRLSIVDGYYDAKLVEAPIALDSANSIPSGIECVIGPFQSRLYGERSHGTKANSRVVNGIADFSGTNQPFSVAGNEMAAGRIRSRGLNPMLAMDTGFNTTPPPTTRSWWRAQSGQPGLMIRPGEGIAVLASTDGISDTSPFNIGGFQFLFNYIPIQMLSQPSFPATIG